MATRLVYDHERERCLYYETCDRCGSVRQVRSKTRKNSTGLCKDCKHADPKVFAIDTKRRMQIAGVEKEEDLGD